MCGEDIESTNHFLLQSSLFLKESEVHVNTFCDIDSRLIEQNKNSLCYDSENAHILNATIEYILSTERFNVFYLNKSKLLQLILTTVMTDLIVF